MVDRTAYRLLKDGAPLPLSPKALDLLILFLDRPAALVTKDDMLKALWPDVAVTDNALTQVVSELRQALGDQPAAPRYIQTVPRRGYRFVADVTSDDKLKEMFGGLQAREPASQDAYSAFTDGRLKLETLDPEQVAPAMADFERALALDPKYALAHVGLAHAHFWVFQGSRARNNPDAAALMKAVAHVRRAIELDGDLAEAHSALALFLIGADRPVEAVAAGRRALALEPGVWRHQFRLGVATWGQERLDCLQAVLVQFPQMTYAAFGIAMLYIARGDLRKAQGILQQALELQADAAVRLERLPGRGLYWLKGLVSLALGDAAEASEAFDRELASQARALFAEEFAMDAYDGLGFVMLKEGNGRGAAGMFDKALARYPKHARSLVGKASALRLAGDWPAADRALEAAGSAVDELRAHGRTTEAALATSFRHVVAGEPVTAIHTLTELLTSAPPGYAGWTLPIEPLLTPLRGDEAFAAVLGRLAERAR